MKTCFFTALLASCMCLPLVMAQNPPVGHEAPERTPEPKTAKRQQIDWYKNAEWLLVVIGCLTVPIIGWQSWETRRSASATKTAALATLKQAELTESSMKQWVELENWKSKMLPGSEQMAVSFEVSNPTNFLLTPEYGEMDLSGPNPTKIVFIYRPAPLGPRNPINIRISIPLGRPAAENYFAGNTIGWGIEGRIEYRTVFDKKVTQRFNGLLSCGHTETTFQATIHPDQPREHTTKLFERMFRSE